MHHYQVRQCHFLLRYKGATTFPTWEKEEILEGSRREALMMICLQINVDLTQLS
jgi:hypothetical protein